MGIIGGVLLWLFLYLTPVLAPFIIGTVFFCCIEPLAMWLHRKKWSKVWATGASMALLIVLLSSFVGITSAIGVGKIIGFAKTIPAYSNDVATWLDGTVKSAKEKLSMVPADTWEEGKKQLESVVKKTGQMLSDFLIGGIATIGAFSKFLFNLILGAIFAFLLSVERERLERWYYVNMPLPIKKVCSFLGKHVVVGFAGYIKAQLKLISITFMVVLVSLMLLGIKNAFSISLTAAIVDIIPLLGVSTVFIPWILYLVFITHQIKTAIWITALWISVVVVRNVLEPKVTGQSIGVSAFDMFATMMLCIGLFGLWGAFLSPVVVLVCKALWKEGHLSYWMQVKPLKQTEKKVDTQQKAVE